MDSFEGMKDNQEDQPIIDADLVLLIAQIYNFFNNGAQQRLAHSPISSDSLWFLAAIMVLGDNATPSQLARWMVRKQNTISGLTKRMEKKGFVTKKKIIGANNRIYLRIVLTKKGKQFLENQSQNGASLVQEVFSRLTLEDKRQLRRLLLITRENAAQVVKGYEEPPYPESERTAKLDYTKLAKEIFPNPSPQK